MALKTKPFDVADYLTDDKTLGYYLTDALESRDARVIAGALGDIARAKGVITRLARGTGLTREALHRALSDGGNPEFATVVKVLKALGVKLTASIPRKRKAVARPVAAKRKPIARSVAADKRKAA
jgi:probable addiction module antidote protein